jgi:translation elongation factor EF-Tu-like GTPase
MGGRQTPVKSGYRPSFGFNTVIQYAGEIRLIDKKELQPGQTSLADINLLPAKTIRKNIKSNDAFTITEGNKTVGTGVIETVEMV